MTHDDFSNVSFELGRNAEGLERLKESFDKHCDDDDSRHKENVKLLTANNDAIAALKKALDERQALTPGGEFMSRKQLAILALIGTGVMVAVGWILEAALKWAVGWLIGAILKIKMGA